MNQTKFKNLNELKSSVDIIEIVNYYIPLKKIGSNYMCNCPFHSEKTPSFSVHIKGMFYCFGCHAKGDVFNFVQKFESCSFNDAVIKIANISGFNLISENCAEKKVNLYQIITNYAHENLLKTDYVKYFLNRGLSMDTIKKWNLGYLGSNYEILSFLRSKNLDKEAIKREFLKETNNGLYCIFNNRLLFNISNHYGEIVAFVGRVMDNKTPKYINSKASLEYDKSRVLYGYHMAKPFIKKNKRVIIVEGYIDTLSLYEKGIKEVVGSGGTAFTINHLGFFLKDNIEINFLFDNDTAGVDASNRAIKLCLQHNYYNAFFLKFKDNFKDANDFLLSNKEFSNEVEKIDIITYTLRYILIKEDFYNTSERAKKLIAKAKVERFLRTIKDSYLRSLYANDINKIFNGHINIANSEKEVDNKPKFNDIFRAEILKTAYYDESKINILKKYFTKDDFMDLKEVYQDLINGELGKELALIVFSDEIEILSNFDKSLFFLASDNLKIYKNRILDSNLDLKSKIKEIDILENRFKHLEYLFKDAITTTLTL